MSSKEILELNLAACLTPVLVAAGYPAGYPAR